MQAFQIVINPALYKDFEFAEDLQLTDGSIIKEGTLLSEIFPKGIIITEETLQFTQQHQDHIELG